MTDDLYAILGVSRDADVVAIDRAFRKMAAVHHPDCGGDARKFDAVKRAREILKNPERRARYDATGDTGETPPEGALRAAGIGIVQGLLDQIIAEWINESKFDPARDPRQHDLVEVMKFSLRKNLEIAEANVADAIKAKEAFLDMATRFTETMKDEPFAKSFVVRAQRAEDQRAGFALNIAQIKAALEVLAETKFRTEKFSGVRVVQTPATTGSSVFIT